MRKNIPRQILLFTVILLTVAADTADAKRGYRWDTGARDYDYWDTYGYRNKDGHWGKYEYGDARDTTYRRTSRDAMNVLGDKVTDLGNGPLQTFVVQPGETARFLFDVYEDEYEYILGGRTVQKKGALYGSMPAFTIDLEGTYWKYRPREFYTIMLDDIYREPSLFAYEMKVGIDTPADFYLMEAVLAGIDEGENVRPKLGWYQTEQFYVEVRDIPEPSSLALVVTLGAGSLLLPILQRRKRNCETALQRRHAQRPDARRCRGIRGWPWLRKKKKIALPKNDAARNLIPVGQTVNPANQVVTWHIAKARNQ